MGEAFFKTIKSQLVWLTVFYTSDQATHAIARYIDSFCNPVRHRSAFDYISLPAVGTIHDPWWAVTVSNRRPSRCKREDSAKFGRFPCA